MTSRFSRLIAAVTITTMIASCAYTFHPERRGNTGGEIAGGSLVGDLLWLIPGLLPGVVFLVVDFTSGAIYREGPDRGGARVIIRAGAETPHTYATQGQATVAKPY